MLKGNAFLALKNSCFIIHNRFRHARTRGSCSWARLRRTGVRCLPSADLLQSFRLQHYVGFLSNPCSARETDTVSFNATESCDATIGTTTKFDLGNQDYNRRSDLDLYCCFVTLGID